MLPILRHCCDTITIYYNTCNYYCYCCFNASATTLLIMLWYYYFNYYCCFCFDTTAAILMLLRYCGNTITTITIWCYVPKIRYCCDTIIATITTTVTTAVIETVLYATLSAPHYVCMYVGNDVIYFVYIMLLYYAIMYYYIYYA